MKFNAVDEVALDGELIGSDYLLSEGPAAPQNKPNEIQCRIPNHGATPVDHSLEATGRPVNHDVVRAEVTMQEAECARELIVIRLTQTNPVSIVYRHAVNLTQSLPQIGGQTIGKGSMGELRGVRSRARSQKIAIVPGSPPVNLARLAMANIYVFSLFESDEQAKGWRGGRGPVTGAAVSSRE
jgi:hypothetical protein